jgi:hypothetical protein
MTKLSFAFRPLDIYHTNASTLVGWWTRRRRIPSTVCRLGTLELNAVLLAVVTLVRASAAVVSVVVVVVCGSGVWWGGLLLVIVVGCGGLIVVVGAGTRCPACAVEGLATGFAAAAGC